MNPRQVAELRANERLYMTRPHEFQRLAAKCITCLHCGNTKGHALHRVVPAVEAKP